MSARAPVGALQAHLARYEEALGGILAAREGGGAAAGAEAAWLTDVRRAALARLPDVGFPSPRGEDWRHVPLDVLAGHPFLPVPEAADCEPDPAALAALAARLGRLALPGPRLVFVNGRLAPGLSTPAAASPGGQLPVLVTPLRHAAAEEPEFLPAYLARPGSAGTAADAFAALNTAFFQDGALVVARADAPDGDGAAVVHLVMAVTPPGAHGHRRDGSDGGPASGPSPALYWRNVLVAEAGTRLTVVEHLLDLGAGGAPPGAPGGARGGDPGGAPSCHRNGDAATARVLADVVTEVVVGPGAHLTRVVIEEEREGTLLLATTAVEAGEGARFSSCHFAVGDGALARSDLLVRLAGRRAEALISGVHAAQGRRHVVVRTRVEHAGVETRSVQEQRALLAGRATGHFRGLVRVLEGAVRSDARQSCRNLLLEPGASAHAWPQLEIRSDDVRCSHGATVSRPDPEAMFFLRSRGLDEAESRRLLARAFVAGPLQAVPLEGVRSYLEGKLDSCAGLGFPSAGGARTPGPGPGERGADDAPDRLG